MGQLVQTGGEALATLKTLCTCVSAMEIQASCQQQPEQGCNQSLMPVPLPGPLVGAAELIWFLYILQNDFFSRLPNAETLESHYLCTYLTPPFSYHRCSKLLMEGQYLLNWTKLREVWDHGQTVQNAWTTISTICLPSFRAVKSLDGSSWFIPSKKRKPFSGSSCNKTVFQRSCGDLLSTSHVCLS